jgi:hypothetical protein
MLFELPDLPAYRAVRNVQLRCRQRHAGETASGFKSAKSLQWGEAVEHHMRDIISRIL